MRPVSRMLRSALAVHCWSGIVLGTASGPAPDQRSGTRGAKDACERASGAAPRPGHSHDGLMVRDARASLLAV